MHIHHPECCFIKVSKNWISPRYDTLPNGKVVDYTKVQLLHLELLMKKLQGHFSQTIIHVSTVSL